VRDSVLGDLSDQSDGSFHIRIREAESENLLELAGLIRVEAAQQLLAAANRLLDDSKDVAVDWREASHVGACAIQLLLALTTELAHSGRKLHVASDNAHVRRTLELAGLSERFPAPEARCAS
jgi:anti-anti-sigma factor